MNFRPRDKRPRRAYGARLAAAIALAAALVALRVFAPGVTSRAATALALPFWNGGNAVREGASASQGLVRSKQSLIIENSDLRRRLDEAERRIASMQTLESDNAELRRLLSLTQANSSTAAVVLAKPPQSPYDSLVIGFGAGSSIAPGDLVFAGEDALLGEIAEVRGDTAVARLYSTAGTAFDAVVERTNVGHGIVGAGGGNFELKVPKEVDVENGDSLVVPDLRRKVVGIVSQVDARPSDSFKRALIKSPVNIFELKWVTVETKRP